MKYAGPSLIKKYLPIIAVMLFWGSMGIPSAYALEEISPLTVLCLRSAAAVLVLFPAVFFRYHGCLPHKEEIHTIALMALVGVVMCNYLYFYAIRNTSLTNVAVIYALGPVFTTVLAALFLRETVRQSRVLGTLIAFAGVFALLTGGNVSAFFKAGFQKGDAAELASAFCLAVYTVLSRNIKKTNSECVTLWMMIFGTMITIPLLLLTEGLPVFSFSATAFLSVIYLGVFCSGAGYLLQQISIRHIGAAASSAFLYAISPITILSAAAVLGEDVSLWQIGCMAVVLLGVILNAYNRDFTK